MSDNKITQDQLEPNVIEELESGIGDLSTLSTENKDSLVAAVTEIYGKNVIAEAIGEPLAVTDTFSEMGNEINSLLSSFKTNMMNAGVVVESGYKFKALIDKIKGLTESEGNVNSGLNIISATELPATGKENQICVVTDNPVDNFRISNLQTDILNDGNIYLKLGSGSGPSSGNITIGDTVQTIYHVDGIYQNSTKLKSYVYQDGNWIEFTKTGIDIMVNGSYTVDSETYGTLKERSGDITFTDGNGLWMNHGLVSSGRSGYMHTYLTEKIDISGFTKVKVTLKDMDYGGTASTYMIATLHFFDSAPTVSLLTNPDEDENYPYKTQSIGRSDFASKEIVYDISDMTGSYYLDFEIYTPADDEGYYVDVRLTDFSIE